MPTETETDHFSFHVLQHVLQCHITHLRWHQDLYHISTCLIKKWNLSPGVTIPLSVNETVSLPQTLRNHCCLRHGQILYRHYEKLYAPVVYPPCGRPKYPADPADAASRDSDTEYYMVRVLLLRSHRAIAVFKAFQPSR